MVAGLRGVVLGYAGFDFAHKVGADVGCLGVDAATHTGKESLGRRTHAEGEHRGGDHGHLLGSAHIVNEAVEDDVPDGDVEEAEADNDEAHHRAGAESHAQAPVEALAGSVGSAGRGIGSRLHAEEAREA